uniref:Uncharacterized protein n=1 Tax=Anguilla anguilla TaxID=7936 RepID=A0A0E9QEU9_ANGAN
MSQQFTSGCYRNIHLINQFRSFKWGVANSGFVLFFVLLFFLVTSAHINI